MHHHHFTDVLTGELLLSSIARGKNYWEWCLWHEEETRTELGANGEPATADRSKLGQSLLI